jgi:hypothetical protein
MVGGLLMSRMRTVDDNVAGKLIIPSLETPTLGFTNALKLSVEEGKNVVLTVRLTGTITGSISAR